MKDIKQIRTKYDVLCEKDNSEMNKLTSLVRAGLFDPKKINVLKRALDKDVSKMTPADKKILIELLEVLMSEVLGSSQVYSKVKSNLTNEEINEEVKDYLSKFDPKFDVNAKDLPSVIILKKKAVRLFPDGQRIGLYYSQALDKYVSIPFNAANNLPTMNEAMDYKAAYTDLRKKYGDDIESDEKKNKKGQQKPVNPEFYERIVKKNLYRVKSKHYAGFTDPEKRAVRKSVNKQLRQDVVQGKVSPDVYLGVKAGQAVVGAARLVGAALKPVAKVSFGKLGKPKTKSTPSITPSVPTPSTPSPSTTAVAPKSTPATSKAPAINIPMSSALKSKAIQQVAAKRAITSTSGTTTAAFKKPLSPAMTAKVNVPVSTTAPSAQAKPEKIKTPKKKKEVVVPGTGPQPDVGEKAFAEPDVSTKVKTLSYSSAVAPKIPNVKERVPKKAGGVFLIPSHPSKATQPIIKDRPLKASFMNKLAEQRNMSEEDKKDFATSLRSKFRQAFDIPDDPEHDNSPTNRKISKYVNAAAKAAEHPAVQGVLAATAISRGMKILRGYKGAAAGAGVAASTKNISSSSAGAIPSAEPRKFTTPGEFGHLKPTLVTPQGETKVGYETRMRNAYQRSVEKGQVNEATKKTQEKRYLKPSEFGNLKVRTSTASGNTQTRSAVDQRLTNAYLRGAEQGNLYEHISNMVREKVELSNITVDGNSILINNHTANRIVQVYESLSKSNKTKMMNIMNEGNIDSIKKLIDFTVRQQ